MKIKSVSKSYVVFLSILFYLCFFLLPFSSKSQCVNADFSSGNFTNWIGSTGINSYGDYSNVVQGIVQGTTNSTPSDSGRQTIINAPGTDPNTGHLLSVLPPGGSSCARLGNMNYNGEAERLIYPIVVNDSDIFYFQYAVVLEDPGHFVSEQPQFTIHLHDTLGNILDSVCGMYEVSAAAGLAGFNTSAAYDDGETVRWKDWTIGSFDLSAYIGTSVYIEFTTFDCSINQGAHFGYAYISCSCDALHLNQQCDGSNSIITAPPGYANYLWSTGDTTQSVTYSISMNGTIVSCQCTSPQGCVVSLQTTVSVTPPVYTLNIPPPICEGQSATISVTGSDSYQWSTGETGNSITVSPATTTTYTLSVNATACSASGSVTVTVGGYTITPEICLVSVDTSSNHNIIVWEKPSTGGIAEYYIYRESSVSGIYNLIGTHNFSDYSTYIDSASNTLQQPYRYKLAINDTCGTLSQQSNHHQSLHLTVNAGSGGSWNLLWNNYEGFSFSTYNIYRGTSNSNMSLLNSVASTVTSYTDVTPPSGVQYYLIEVVKPAPCNPSIKSGESVSSSISNIATTQGLGLEETFNNNVIDIYPNPSNGLFTLTFSGQSNKSILIEVINSIGQKVFKKEMDKNTTDVDISTLSDGMYTLKISVDGRIYYRKMMIE